MLGILGFLATIGIIIFVLEQAYGSKISADDLNEVAPYIFSVVTFIVTFLIWIFIICNIPFVKDIFRHFGRENWLITLFVAWLLTCCPFWAYTVYYIFKNYKLDIIRAKEYRKKQWKERIEKERKKNE